MSTDIQLTHRCSHLTIEERVVLNPDRMTLDTSQPVASLGSVRITANDQLTIPRSGVQTFAHLVGLSAGPFRILKNENQVSISSISEEITATLPIGERVPVDDIVRVLRRLSSDIFFSNANGHLEIIETASIGKESRIRVRGAALSALGFSGQNGVQGKNLYPGWRLVQRAGSSDPSDRMPRFESRLKKSPILKVTYAAPGSKCRRCQSTLIENDYRFDAAGDVILIENENLLVQAALKIVLTHRGSSIYHPFYGTSIHLQVGAKAISSVASIIEEDVRRALTNLQLLQQRSGSALTYKERIYRINSVRVTPHSNDRTTFRLDIVITNASQEPVRVSRVFTTPSVVSVVPGVGVTANARFAGLSESAADKLFLRS